MQPISFDKLPHYVPGDQLADGQRFNIGGFGYRRYAYDGLDVELPPLLEYMIISYRSGTTPVHRRAGGGWKDENLGVRDLTMLTRSCRSEWSWTSPIEVSHLYLSQSFIEDIANEVFETSVSSVRLGDVLRTRDLGINRCVSVIEGEADMPDAGGKLIVDAAARELGVRLLRRYCDSWIEDARLGRLSPAQERAARTFVQEQIGANLSYQDAAREVGLGPWNFAKRFKASFGVTFHQFVTEQRVAFAKREVMQTSKPLKTIAMDFGFSDQSHMTRAFRRGLGITPGELRRR